MCNRAAIVGPSIAWFSGSSIISGGNAIVQYLLSRHAYYNKDLEAGCPWGKGPLALPSAAFGNSQFEPDHGSACWSKRLLWLLYDGNAWIFLAVPISDDFFGIADASGD